MFNEGVYEFKVYVSLNEILTISYMNDFLLRSIILI